MNQPHRTPFDVCRCDEEKSFNEPEVNMPKFCWVCGDRTEKQKSQIVTFCHECGAGWSETTVICAAKPESQSSPAHARAHYGYEQVTAPKV